MTPAFVVQITTPKKYILNGLWFGPAKPEKVIVFIHGLAGSAFSMQRMVRALQNSQTAVLTFNTRGFEQISGVKRRIAGKTTWIQAGSGHEIFAESADDVQGAVDLAKRSGAKEIYLAGHSTGAQKACYWAYKSKREKKVKGMFLLGPLSDYASALEQDTHRTLKQAVAHAKKLVGSGRPHELMPKKFSPWLACDAQRFLGLYTPDSIEEIFSYAQPRKTPRILKAIGFPALVFFAGKDEYSKRPAREIAAWFEKHLKGRHKVVVVPNVGHGFKGGEKRVAREVKNFMKEQYN